MAAGDQDILSAPVCVRWHTGRCIDAQADLNLAIPVYTDFDLYNTAFMCGNQSIIRTVTCPKV